MNKNEKVIEIQINKGKTDNNNIFPVYTFKYFKLLEEKKKKIYLDPIFERNWGKASSTKQKILQMLYNKETNRKLKSTAEPQQKVLPFY